MGHRTSFSSSSNRSSSTSLSESSSKRSNSFWARDGWSGRALSVSPRLRAVGSAVSTASGHACDGWRLENNPDRQLHSQRPGDARNDLCGQQRMAAQMKKIIVNADLIALKNFAPDFGQQCFGCISRRRLSVRPRRLERIFRRRQARAGPLCRWASSGSFSNNTMWDGTMKDGSCIRQKFAQL